MASQASPMGRPAKMSVLGRLGRLGQADQARLAGPWLGHGWAMAGPAGHAGWGPPSQANQANQANQARPAIVKKSDITTL